MSWKLFLLILASVSLSAIAQITMKAGMSNDMVQEVLAKNGGLMEKVRIIGANSYVISGVLLYGLSAALWLLVLARLDVSKAYPFVALGFILTMFLGYLILGEAVGLNRIIGTILVVAGVVLVSHS